jgi:hypothetical protein
MSELPEKIRVLIRDEIEDGLDRFRAGGFESRLKEGFRTRPAVIRCPPARPLLKWAPVLGFVLTAVAIGAAVLWFGRTPAPSSPGLAATLAELPGFLTLDQAFVERIPSAGSSTMAESPILRAFAAAAASAGSAGPERITLRKFAPRYSLEEKFEILITEQPIERALAMIKNQHQGDLT